MNRQAVVEQIPALRRYARALTGNAWAADDLVQDTLERACGKWRLWAVGSDLRAWLFTLMHNLFASQLRSAVRQPVLHAVDIDEVAHELAAPDSGQSVAIDLQRCLLLLPEEQRAVLLLVSLEDLSYEQVAKVLGIPVGTVMSRLSRARSRLRELMGGASAASGNEAPQRASDSPPGLRRLK